MKFISPPNKEGLSRKRIFMLLTIPSRTWNDYVNLSNALLGLQQPIENYGAC